MLRWYGLVARDYTSLDRLKGKKIGVARGSASEVFWLAMIDKFKLNAALRRNRAARKRHQAARGRHDICMWQVERRKRTRHLIELGGLTVKAGIVDLTGADRATI
jgi:ABC-type amino acid transport substrate-binding protein